jgi:tRNA pseudouridine38-40 synthase
VQSTLTAAVSQVAGEPVVLHAAGRTDAGVHALGQVVHFDSRARRSARQWQLGVNSSLPEDVAVSWAAEVPADFDARRSAIFRRYRYCIEQSPRRPVLSRRTVWWLRERVSCAAMTAAAVYWLGEHDFSAFRAAGCQSRTPQRCLSKVQIGRRGARISLEFTANAFLYHMVRNLVGTLAAIGRGAAEPAAAGRLLAGRDRKRAAPTAPACGLTLVEVGYPAGCLPANIGS